MYHTHACRSQKSRSTSAMSEPPSEGTGLTGRPLAGLLELTSGELSSGGRARLRGAPAEPRGGGGAPPPAGGGGPPFLRRGLASLGSDRATHATAALLLPTDTRITGTMTSDGAGQPASMAHNSCTHTHCRFRRPHDEGARTGAAAPGRCHHQRRTTWSQTQPAFKVGRRAGRSARSLRRRRGRGTALAGKDQWRAPQIGFAHSAPASSSRQSCAIRGPDRGSDATASCQIHTGALHNPELLPFLL
ncbi:hypothetical protein HPB50_018567 [Hyalomma asiaticum]|uniref:Uncharacterized protein n=1 Tax=Hyalomma asiaticum TaxID=266040 RepID=A0ACB7SW89_HYAAI|nr:hypothetical protein HPB50_018567 [Hyalomma asiaticum]